MTTFRIDSLDGIKAHVKDVQRALDNKADFKDFYRCNRAVVRQSWNLDCALCAGLFDFIKEEGERKTIGSLVGLCVRLAVGCWLMLDGARRHQGRSGVLEPDADQALPAATQVAQVL